MSLIARLRSIISPKRRDSELQEELRFHLDAEMQRNIASGLSPDEAARQAQISLGGVQQTREAVRSIHWTQWVATLVQDIRFGSRMLLRAPGFTVVAVITLALGIGANTAVFSSADALLLRPLPFPNLDRLVTVFMQNSNGGLSRQMTPADFRYYDQQTKAFDELALFASRDFNVTGGALAEKVSGAEVSANFFETIAMGPILGRTFAHNEDLPGRAKVAVISYGLWTRRFGADPKIAGSDIRLNGSPYTVIGVMDKPMMFPGGAELWVPVEWTDTVVADHKSARFEVLGRLRSGATLAQAQAEMKTHAAQLAGLYPAINKDLSIQLRPLRLVVNGTMMLPFTETLFISALLVLLLSCANVATLQLSRGTARNREMTVRAALGARRGRLMRQLLVENLLLSVLGSMAALVLARWVVALQVTTSPPILLRLVAGLSEMRVDHRAMLFTLVVAVFSTVAAGVLPALAGTRLNLTGGLKERTQSSSGRSRHRMRSALVAAQIALAVALLGGTILILRGFQAMAETSRSFASDRVLTFAVTLPSARYSSATTRSVFYRDALEKFAAMPGVQSPVLFSSTPLSNNGVSWVRFRTEQQADLTPQRLTGAITQNISANYFETMKIPLLAGRRFNPETKSEPTEVAIINQRLAQRFFHGGDAIGQRVKIVSNGQESAWMEIVGIAGDVLYDWTDDFPEYTIYRPFAQAAPPSALFALRASVTPLSLTSDVRSTVAQIDSDLPIYEVKTLAQAIDEGVSSLKTAGDFIAALGLIALILSAVGIYGVMACSVAERRQEIGIRMALGADHRKVVLMVLRRGLLLTSMGVLAGLPLAVLLSQSLSSLSFGTKQGEPLIVGACALILAVVALAACMVPARRATKVDPLVALRYE